MNREECWMTFSEALEMYLSNRESAQHFGVGRNRESCAENMRIAADHMDALTSAVSEDDL